MVNAHDLGWGDDVAGDFMVLPAVFFGFEFVKKVGKDPLVVLHRSSHA